MAEAVSVIARRAAQRRHNPPDTAAAIEIVRQWHEVGSIGFRPITSSEFLQCLSLVDQTRGALNFNDARLVVMQRSGAIGAVASFDRDPDEVAGFERVC